MVLKQHLPIILTFAIWAGKIAIVFVVVRSPISCDAFRHICKLSWQYLNSNYLPWYNQQKLRLEARLINTQKLWPIKSLGLLTLLKCDDVVCQCACKYYYQSHHQSACKQSGQKADNWTLSMFRFSRVIPPFFFGLERYKSGKGIHVLMYHHAFNWNIFLR